MKHSITVRAFVIGLLWLMLVAAAFGSEPGHLIDIGGRNLHVVQTEGDGPVVVFEAGGGAFSNFWLSVQPRAASELGLATMSYDRAGLGWSESAHKDYEILDKAEDLNALLSALNVEEPIILVGHSYGGWVARAFAHLNPERLAGLILVDPNSAYFFQKYPGKVARIEADGARRPIRGLKRIGLKLQRNWFAKRTGAPRSAFQPILTDRHQAALGAMLEAFGATSRRMGSVHLPDVPTILISRGLPQKGFPWGDCEAELNWRKGHQRLIEGLSTAEHWIAERSSHAVIVDEPQIVLDAIRRMLEILAVNQDDDPASDAANKPLAVAISC